MKQFFKSALLAVAIAGASTASAENLAFNFDANANEYGLKGHVDYHADMQAYPNLWVTYPDFNSTTPAAAADGERVFSRVNIKLDVTGPGGYTRSENMNYEPAFPTAESFSYCFIGELATGGTYNFTAELTLTYADESKAPLVENFSGNFIVPTHEVNPAEPTLNYEIISTTEGADFKYSIDLGTNSPEDVESVLVALLTGGEAFNTDAKFHSTELSATIPVHFDAKELGIWLKALVTMKDGTTYQLKPWDRGMTLVKAEDPNKPNVTYTLTVGEFTRTGETSGTLPYTITCDGDIDLVDHWIVWASRAGDENMNVTDVWALEGILNLTVLPANAQTPIWPKVQAVWKAGGRGDVYQTTCTVDTRSADTPVYSIIATNPQPETATTGKLDYEITVTKGAENIEKFVIYVVRQRLEDEIGDGDVEVGRLETTETSGTIILTNLKEKSTTELWVKAYAIDKSGTELATVQYPGEAQGWTGLSIDTTATEVNAIDAITSTNEATYFNLQGLKVADPEKGKIYIVVRNGKPSKVIF